MTYENYEDMRASLTSDEILKLVNHALKDKAYRDAYHKKYNAQKVEALKLVRELKAAGKL